ncbi:hypothetical protein JM93_01138 [Roseibium hamelinense]|uniref:Extensin-like C-terminal domain-containing protein n=1 Tax=Roseibium hamelinense TaxID=150831 RepID=A0A562T967_9HYPH|nr:extensin family protein [Roseibium hamelinense]MTI45465.1 extensin family protein [Roseibium hamelinense]TWI90161.1 hypothetical protein JM93_01138 [Roseibium hamelinense]
MYVAHFARAALVLLVVLLCAHAQAEGIPKLKPEAETDSVLGGPPTREFGVPQPKPGHSQTVGGAGETRQAESDQKNSAAAAPVLCGLKNAEYSQVEPIVGENGCGIPAPVLVESFGLAGNQISLSRSATLSCGFSKTLGEWVRKDLNRIAKEHLNTTLGTLVTGPGYVCRRRNNQPDGKLSEHALGTAIDITAFQTADGKTVSVEKDWGTETPKGRFLSDVHASACARFTTVLGPDVDPNHKSHFHLDIGCHGQACTYLICQ